MRVRVEWHLRMSLPALSLVYLQRNDIASETEFASEPVASVYPSTSGVYSGSSKETVWTSNGREQVGKSKKRDPVL